MKIGNLVTAAGFASVLLVATSAMPALAGFGTTAELFVEPAVTQDQLAPYRVPGTAKIQGRFNLVMNGTIGRLEYAGYDVYALPAIPWSYWYAYEITYGADNQRYDFDAVRAQNGVSLGDLVRHDRTDDSGRFEFDQLPPGKWIIVSRVSASIDSTRTTENDVDDYYLGLRTEYIHTSITTCHPVAALEAVVTVGAGQTITTPIGISGWRYDFKC
jgi:hypothetical protein